MSLLFNSDYEYIKDCGLSYEEEEGKRFFIFTNFPLPNGMYISDGPIEIVEVLCIIPSNYNSSGNDMFWVHPELKRADGIPIPNAFGYGGGDSRSYKGKEYCRWSRHYPGDSWKPKEDNIEKIIDRITWALRNPNANK